MIYIQNAFIRNVTYCINFLLSIAYYFLRILGKRRPLKEPIDHGSIRKVLVIRLDNIGDVLLSTPIFATLKKQYPNAHISALVSSWSHDILRHNRNVDRLFIYDALCFRKARGQATFLSWFNVRLFISLLSILKKLRNEYIDVVIDPRGDLRHMFFFGYLIGARYLLGFDRTGGKYLVSKYVPYTEEMNEVDKNMLLLEPLEIQQPLFDIEIPISHQEIEWVNYFLLNNGIKDNPIVILSPGSRKKLKMWPTAKYVQLSKWITQTYPQAVTLFVGAETDIYLSDHISEADRAINLIGKTTLLQAFALLKKSSLVVTNDGPIAHMVSSLTVPTIVLFGPTSQTRFKPKGNHIYSLQKEYSCSPCALNFCIHTKKRCIAECMDAIDIAEVTHIIQNTICFYKA